ncbi:hypothetical protein [Shewanella sp. ECSMB14102]|uniref:hypothetical protein n=1 Tax=Shewanella sp. ECSMB14102 TaxID=1579504 RepID=UPI0013643C73|nr:hypothetical protein [Shewanella sp. ECSMB14102]
MQKKLHLFIWAAILFCNFVDIKGLNEKRHQLQDVGHTSNNCRLINGKIDLHNSLGMQIIAPLSRNAFKNSCKLSQGIMGNIDTMTASQALAYPQLRLAGIQS